MSTDVAKLSRDYYAAWNSHDWSKVSPFLTDDCFFEDTGEGRVCHGKQEIRAYYEQTVTWSADFKLESKSLFTTGSWVVAEWVMTGTHTGDVPGLKATGKPYSVRGATVIELREGKICRDTEYWNMASFLQQVGVLGTSINWFGRLMMRLTMRR